MTTRAINTFVSNPSVLAHLGDFFRVATLWSFRHESRGRLAEMDDSLLRDIGVDRVEAMQEANKPFWQQ